MSSPRRSEHRNLSTMETKSFNWHKYGIIDCNIVYNERKLETIRNIRDNLEEHNT